MLSPLTWNYWLRPVPSVPVNIDVVFKKQCTNCTLRNRTQVVRHNRLPMLMSCVIDVVMGNVSLPLITVPTRVAVIGANVRNPSKEDLLVARLTNLVH